MLENQEDKTKETYLFFFLHIITNDNNNNNGNLIYSETILVEDNAKMFEVLKIIIFFGSFEARGER